MGKRTDSSKQKPFWKKKRTEQEASISEHIGKLIDRLSLDDIFALGIGAWGAIQTESWQGFPLGLLGYKLATVRGGTPPVSQMAGLGMLAFTGLIPVLPAFGDALEDTKKFLADRVPSECVNKETGKINLDCVIGYALGFGRETPAGGGAGAG